MKFLKNVLRRQIGVACLSKDNLLFKTKTEKKSLFFTPSFIPQQQQQQPPPS